MLARSLYELLTGLSPIVMTEDVIDRSLWPIISKATAENHSRRYQSIAEMSDASNGYFRSLDPTAHPEVLIQAEIEQAAQLLLGNQYRKEKNVSLRRRAKIQCCATCTVTSTFDCRVVCAAELAQSLCRNDGQNRCTREQSAARCAMARSRHSAADRARPSRSRHRKLREHSDVRAYEVRDALCLRRFGTYSCSRPRRRRTARRIHARLSVHRQTRSLARIVDEALVTGAMHLTHPNAALLPPRPIAIAVRRVAIAARMRLQILQVQQLQCYACATKLGVDVHRRRFRSRCRGRLRSAEQPTLEFRVRARLCQLPREPHVFSAATPVQCASVP